MFARRALILTLSVVVAGAVVAPATVVARPASSELHVLLLAPAAERPRFASELGAVGVRVSGRAISGDPPLQPLLREATSARYDALILVASDAGFVGVYPIPAGKRGQRTLLRSHDEAVGSLALRVAEYVGGWKAERPASARAQATAGGGGATRASVAGAGVYTGRDVSDQPARSSPASARGPRAAAGPARASDKAKKPVLDTPAAPPAATGPVATVARAPAPPTRRFAVEAGLAGERDGTLGVGAFIHLGATWRPTPAAPWRVRLLFDIPASEREVSVDAGAVATATWLAGPGLARRVFARAGVQVWTEAGVAVAYTTATGRAADDRWQEASPTLVSAAGWLAATARLELSGRWALRLDAAALTLTPTPVIAAGQQDLQRRGAGLLRLTTAVEVAL